jgi:predicted dehydrogenase
LKERIRVGIIGAGFIGPAHLEALRRLGFVDVVALATSGEESAAKKAKALSIPNHYGDYRDLIDSDIDVVQITSPNNLHFPQARAALEAGKHVVCDKPLVLSSAESKILVELARNKGLVNAVTFNHRFYPLVQQSRALVRQAKLGEVFLIQGGFHQDWLLFDTDYNWRVDAKSGGTPRAVGDIGTHWLDTVQYITGLKVKAVFADLRTLIPVRKKPKASVQTFAGKGLKPTDYEEVPVDTEDLAIVILRFTDSDARGVMTVSQVSAGRKCRLLYEIFGTEGGIEWDSERPNQLWLGYRDKPNELLIKDPALLDPSARPSARYPGGHGEGFPDSHTHCERTIYEYIREEKFRGDVKPDFPTFQDGHEEQLICEAILESNRRGAWVTVEYS